MVHLWLLSALFAALTAVLAKIGIRGVNSDLATAIRVVVILVLTWSIVFFKNSVSEIYNLTKTNWLFLVLSGIATGLSWLFYFKALQVGKLNQVAPLDKSSIVITLVLSTLILGQHLTIKEAFGALLIMGGTLVLVL